jgi:uncharacterized protein YcfL
MKLLIAIMMMFLIVSCASEEDTTFEDQIRDYELRILALEENLKVLTKKVDSNQQVNTNKINDLKNNQASETDYYYINQMINEAINQHYNQQHGYY